MKNPKKGEVLEEVLRNYFLKAGYFVVRGVPFNYEGFDITDIDLWIYGRTSSVSREIAIVDIKNKKTPQAIERIFWVQGLKSAVKANNAIVATTDRRMEVKDFGREQGVLVLDGNFISRLTRSENVVNTRLTEEELYEAIGRYTLGKIDGDWKGRALQSKSLLSRNLSFDSCNLWLEHGKYFAEQVILNPPHKELAYRLCYLISSYVAIAIDYLLRELSFSEEKEREKNINGGFRYGDRGLRGTNSIINASLSLVEQFADNGSSVSNQVRNNLEAELSKLNTEILSEYFSKNDVGKSLFTTAKELENLAMAKNFSLHTSGALGVKSLMGCLLDYWGIDRKSFSS